jgi:hypothetical protein
MARWEAGADAAMDVLREQMTGCNKTIMSRYGETAEVPDNTARRQAAIEWLKHVPGAEYRRAMPVAVNEGPREMVIRMEGINDASQAG